MKNPKWKRKNRKKDWFLKKHFPPWVPLVSNLVSGVVWTWTGKVGIDRHGNKGPELARIACNSDAYGLGSTHIGLGPASVLKEYKETSYHLSIVSVEHLKNYSFLSTTAQEIVRENKERS